MGKSMKRLIPVVLMLVLFSFIISMPALAVNNADDHPRRIIGYFTEWRHGQNDFPEYLVSDISWDKVTHINYAFAKVNQNTNEIDFCNKKAAIEMEFPGQDPSLSYKGHFNLLTKYKEQYPDVKTLISVGGWAASTGFYTMAETAQGREAFANSAVEFLKKYNFDGLDIDYEYPTATSKAGNPDDFDVAEPRRATLFENYVKLMKLLREKLDKAGQEDGEDYLLTVATPASSWILGGMQLGQYAQYLDYLNMMTYDFHGAWNGYVGHNSALLPDARDPETAQLEPVLNIDWGYRYYRGVLPPSKINVGIPYYSRGWRDVQGGLEGGLYGTAKNGDGTGKGAVGIDNIWHDLNKNGEELPGGSNPLWHLQNLLAGRTEFSYTEAYGVTDTVEGTYKRYWDDVSKASYIWNEKTDVFLSLEDKQSMKEKVNYVIDNGVGGIMMWELAGDYDQKSNGEYYMGDTLTSLAYELFKQDGTSADDQMSDIELPTETKDFDIEFSGDYAHPNYTFTMKVVNNTGQEIAPGWTLAFDLPKTTTLKSAWGMDIKDLGEHGDFHRYKLVGPGWKGIPDGGSYSFQGMMKLCFSGGPQNLVLNDKYASVNEVGQVERSADLVVNNEVNTGDYNLTITVPDNSTATTMKLYEDGAVIAEESVTAGQVITKEFTNQVKGNYEYKVDLVTAEGTLTSDPVTVEVVEATNLPTAAQIAVDQATNSGDYKITVTVPAGNAATLMELYEDGTVVKSEAVTADAASDQIIEYQVTGQSSGDYNYYVDLSNANGVATSETITVTVDAANEYPAWDPDKVYTGGEKVSYDGSVWKAKWWTQGDKPGSSQWGPWELVQ